MSDRLPYRWDYNAKRWRGPRGLFVADAVIRAGLGAVEQAAEDSMVLLAERLQAGTISLAAWQDQMADLIKEIWVLETLVRVGPVLSATEEAQLAGQLTRQYQYLQNFAIQIYSGAVPLDGRFLWRVRLYARSASNGAEQTRRDSMRAAGATSERRVLSPAEHCDDCLAAAAQGWQSLGTLPEIGDSACGPNCKCYWEYR